MEIEKTTKYKRELKKVLKTPTISMEKVDKTIETFITNPEHNSLDTKIIKGCSDYTNLHQIRINSDYRILFINWPCYIVLGFFLCVQKGRLFCWHTNEINTLL